MVARCNNPRSTSYHRYGAQGVVVCERWLSFEKFLADVGPRPSLRHSLDRYPDFRGNYEPGNVRWATPVEQANNRQGNRLVVYRGKSLTLAEALRLAGSRVGYSTALQRLNKGWSAERIVETPARGAAA